MPIGQPLKFLQIFSECNFSAIREENFFIYIKLLIDKIKLKGKYICNVEEKKLVQLIYETIQI